MRTGAFYETVGFTAEVADGGAVVKAVDLEPLSNREGWVHGGAIAAIVDAAATQAAAAAGHVGAGAATAELTVSFLEPATGGPLEATGTVVAVHQRRVEVRVEVRAGGGIVAVARVMVTKGKP